MMKLRDYGLGESGTPTGVPTWEKAGEDAPKCPNCGGCLCDVIVPVKHELLKGGKGLSRYLGCPACPFASPALMRAEEAEDAEGGE
jgi:hypothetical protein